MIINFVVNGSVLGGFLEWFESREKKKKIPGS